MSTIQCPICESKKINLFTEIAGMPVYCNRLWSTRDEAIRAPKGDIKLGYCSACGHIYNTAFDPALMDYDEDYDNSLHYSPRFQQYAEALAKRLIEDYALYDKDVIEIGCGKGDFLSMLCEFGKNRGLGFDPSYETDRDSDFKSNRFRVINDYYGEPYQGYNADLICCRQVLEHIQEPCGFLKTVRQTISGQDHAIVFFEVPDAMYTIKDMGVWDLIYEHCGYFTHSSLEYAFHRSGFSALKLESVFEGQFLSIDAKPTEQNAGSVDHFHVEKNHYDQLISDFSENYHAKKMHWKKVLEDMVASGEKGIVWGGGSKGVTFSNALKASEMIEYVVDINPHKQGKYVPGTGQKIVSSEFLGTYSPDVVFVMNPNYLSEIKGYCEELKIYPEFLVV